MEISAREESPVAVRVHGAAAVLFLAVNAAGFAFVGGAQFVQGWGGALAAAFATVFLIVRSRAYWCWMIVNASLWTALFFREGLPVLAWLQVSFLGLALFGLVHWIVVRGAGFDPSSRIDRVGSALAFLVCGIAAWAYGYGGTIWWALEVSSVFLAVAAMWLSAFRHRATWIAWSLSNVASLPLFWHGRLWGPFALLFVYQALNVVGWLRWGEAREPAPRAAAAGAPA